MNTMESIRGYKFDTEQEAVNARKQCADYYGLPTSLENETKYWVDYNTANLDNPIFYYIRFDDSLRIVLGEPETFEVTTPPLPFEI
jgi:hypothetical protein